MILKVKGNNDSWSYFECQVVHTNYVYGMLKNVIPRHINDSVIILSPEIDSKDHPEDKEVNLKYFNLETEGAHLRGVLTDMPAYLLNDQGKTIDRI